jgi:hypothetical protein
MQPRRPESARYRNALWPRLPQRTDQVPYWAIEEALNAPPSLLLRAGHRFLDLVGSAAGDRRQSAAATADGLSNLILGAYRQAEQDPDLHRQCIDLFARLLEVGAHGADEAIEAFSR